MFESRQHMCARPPYYKHICVSEAESEALIIQKKIFQPVYLV